MTAVESTADRAKPTLTQALRQGALRSGRAVAVFVMLTALGLAGDLLSKHFVFRQLLDRPDLARHVELIRDTYQPGSSDMYLRYLGIHRQVAPGVQFTLSTNPGIVFGWSMPRTAVAVATLATMAMVLYFFATSARRERVVHVALAFILGGAMGNLYDRLFGVVRLDSVEIRYQVRDFIDLSQLHYPWVFNIADVLLVAGVALLMLHWLMQGRKSARKQ